MERIYRGEMWLKENREHKSYSAYYEVFLTLFNGLRELYAAIGEPLVDPLAGYDTNEEEHE